MSPKYLIVLGLCICFPALSQCCDLYLSTSTICGAGRGIFAGRAFSKGATIDSTVNIPVRRPHIEGSQLDNYVFDTGIDDFVMVAVGLASLFNHHPTPSTDHTWADHEVAAPGVVAEGAFSTFTESRFGLVEDLQTGQEVFTSYGDSWLEDRGFGTASCEETDLSASPSSQLCMTDVFIAQSTLFGAGKGLFAKRAFTAGEVVAISPTLVLPLTTLRLTSNSSVLWNYCIAPPGGPRGGQIALFPLAQVALANHAPLREEANVALEWLGTPEALGWDLDRLLGHHFAPLDVVLRATRALEVGEEVLLDYGPSWRAAFAQWREGEGAWPFRAMIEAPEGLFPTAWLRLNSREEQREEL